MHNFNFKGNDKLPLPSPRGTNLTSCLLTKGAFMVTSPRGRKLPQRSFNLYVFHYQQERCSHAFKNHLYFLYELLARILYKIFPCWGLVFFLVICNCTLYMKETSFLLHGVLFIYLFRQRGREGGREGERETSVWWSLAHPLLGTWTATQACALTGNRTIYPLVRRLALSPLSHTSQGLLHGVFK